MAAMPVMPMLATSGALPSAPGWGFEFKWDGVRAIMAARAGQVRIFGRRGSEITVAYPELARLGTAGPDLILDGEIVVLDAAGRPSFGALAERIHVRDAQRAARLSATQPVTFMIFDLLKLGQNDLIAQPYAQRRATLESLELNDDHWLTPPMFTDGPATKAAADEHRLEGVVAKRLTSIYRPGQRTPDWVKVKIDRTAEFVVGGWRPGARTLGALFIGEPMPGGALVYRGRVGGGISAATERALMNALRPLVAPDSPFETPVPRIEAREATWVRPELVVEVRYGEITADGRLRFPRFVRIRPDLDPSEVGRE